MLLKAKSCKQPSPPHLSCCARQLRLWHALWQVAEEFNAAVIIMACHNKAYTWDALLLGSVADYATHNSKLPVRCYSG